MQHFLQNLRRPVPRRAPLFAGAIQSVETGWPLQRAKAAFDIPVSDGTENPMRKSCSRIALIVGLFLMFSLGPAGAGALDDARALMNQRQYDKAIVVLETAVSKGNANAQVYFELGRAYQKRF
jgi:TPR repeat protein